MKRYCLNYLITANKIYNFIEANKFFSHSNILYLILI